MKKIIRITIDVIIMLVSVGFFVLLAYQHYKQKGLLFSMQFAAEILCYGLCAFCYLGAFNMIRRRIKSTWGKWVFALLPTALFTIQIMLFNSFFHYIKWFGVFGDAVTYKMYLVGNLSYNVGFGRYRYVLCFILMYALCAIVIFINGNYFKGKVKKICDNFWESLY